VSRGVWEQSKRQAAPNGAVMRCSASCIVYYNDIEKVRNHELKLYVDIRATEHT
jgi:ADP-ribosylglycohydrolase